MECGLEAWSIKTSNVCDFIKNIQDKQQVSWTLRLVPSSLQTCTTIGDRVGKVLEQFVC